MKKLEKPGQAVVELALTLPILFLLLLGGIDVSHLVTASGVNSYAGRQAARIIESTGVVSTTADLTAIDAVTNTLLADGLALSGLQSIDIFRANPSSVTPSDPPSVVSANDNPAMNCVYTFSNGVQQTSGSCGAYSQPGRNENDYFGITIIYHYSGLTMLFANGYTLSSTTYSHFDPLALRYGGYVAQLPTAAVPQTPRTQ